MDRSSRGNGGCPSCEADGVVGAPCSTERCRRLGYHAIPTEYFERIVAATEPADPALGQMWGEQLLVEKLGQGGMGRVYLALQMPIELKTAVKLLDERLHETESPLVDRFMGEAMALAKLTHPNIVRLLKFAIHARRPYLVMEHVDNARTLAAELRRGLDPRTGLKVIRQITHALAAAHAQGIIHRDIKPQNIMLQSTVGNDCFVRIVDFGLAKFTAHGQTTQVLAGTPRYMAPEQFSGRGLGPWTDVYAVMAIAFEILVGEPLYAGLDGDQIRARKSAPDETVTQQLAHLGMAPAVVDLFRRGLAFEARARPPDARALSGAMDAISTELMASANVERPRASVDAPLHGVAPASAHRGASVVSGTDAAASVGVRGHATPHAVDSASGDDNTSVETRGESQAEVLVDLRSDERGPSIWNGWLALTTAAIVLIGAGVGWWMTLPPVEPASAPTPAATGSRPQTPPPSPPTWSDHYATAVEHIREGRVEGSAAALAEALTLAADPNAVRAQAHKDAAFAGHRQHPLIRPLLAGEPAHPNAGTALAGPPKNTAEPDRRETAPVRVKRTRRRAPSRTRRRSPPAAGPRPKRAKPASADAGTGYL